MEKRVKASHFRQTTSWHTSRTALNSPANPFWLHRCVDLSSSV